MFQQKALRHLFDDGFASNPTLPPHDAPPAQPPLNAAHVSTAAPACDIPHALAEPVDAVNAAAPLEPNDVNATTALDHNSAVQPADQILSTSAQEAIGTILLRSLKDSSFAVDNAASDVPIASRSNVVVPDEPNDVNAAAPVESVEDHSAAQPTDQILSTSPQEDIGRSLKDSSLAVAEAVSDIPIGSRKTDVAPVDKTELPSELNNAEEDVASQQAEADADAEELAGGPFCDLCHAPSMGLQLYSCVRCRHFYHSVCIPRGSLRIVDHTMLCGNHDSIPSRQLPLLSTEQASFENLSLGVEDWQKLVQPLQPTRAFELPFRPLTKEEKAAAAAAKKHKKKKSSTSSTTGPELSRKKKYVKRKPIASSTAATEEPKQKRKYVRKKSIGTSASTAGTEEPRKKRKYVKRKALSMEENDGRQQEELRPLPQSNDEAIPVNVKWNRVCRNQYLCSRPRVQGSEASVCSCSNTTRGSSNCGEECVNRLLKIECDPRTCPNQDACTNRRLQRRQYPKLQIIKTPNRGHGLRVECDVKAGDLMVEYCGEVLDQALAIQRIHEMHENNESNFYMMELCKDLTIDAARRGSVGRFINHSCAPNCHTEKWVVGNETRVGIFASSDIAARTELTYDYNFSLFCVTSASKCHCGASTCSGLLGARPKKRVQEPTKKPKKRRQKEASIALDLFGSRRVGSQAQFDWSLNQLMSVFSADSYAAEARSSQLYLARNRRVGLESRLAAIQAHRDAGAQAALQQLAEQN